MSPTRATSPPEPGAPFFSVIVPVHNREQVVTRALESCISQDFADFEIVVVDDGSTDSTRETVIGIGDPRIRVLRHGSNLGPCAARNTGLASARGSWLVMLDSDDELTPHALSRLAEIAARAAPDVGNIATRCRWDDGSVSPALGSPSVSLDYRAFLRWTDRLPPGRREWLNCIRREVFETTRYPPGRSSEGGFHLDLVSRWRFQLFADVCVSLHSDVEGITRARRSAAVRHMRLAAKDSLVEVVRILARHGEGLRSAAPRRYREYLQIAAVNSFLLGRRRSGITYAARATRQDAWDVRTWAVTALGLVSGQVLAGVRAFATTRNSRTLTATRIDDRA